MSPRLAVAAVPLIACSCSLLLPVIGDPRHHDGGGGDSFWPDAGDRDGAPADADPSDGPRGDADAPPDADADVDADSDVDVDADADADADADMDSNTDADASEDADLPPPEEICEGGVDEDGDGAVDCDDSDCFGLAICSSCPGAGSISCGGSLRGDTSTGASRIDSYGCSGAVDATGPEVSYAFRRTGSGTVRVTLDSDHSLDIELFVVRADGGDCDPAGGCVVGSQRSDGWEQVSFTASGGETYYIVVDSYRDTTTDSFVLTVECW